MEITKIEAIIESILFANAAPVTVDRLIKAIGVTEEEIRSALESLKQKYQNDDRGLAIMAKDQEVLLTTKGEFAPYINDFVKNELQENLSKAALEVLSIIAYRSPISRLEIEAIRGVNCSFTLRTLLMRGLVERIDNPSDGRGYLYKISFDFLKKLGISQIEDLPEYINLRKDERISSIIGK